MSRMSRLSSLSFQPQLTKAQNDTTSRFANSGIRVVSPVKTFAKLAKNTPDHTTHLPQDDIHKNNIQTFLSRPLSTIKHRKAESFITGSPGQKQLDPTNRGMTSSEPSAFYNRYSEPQSSNPMQKEKKYILVIDDETSVREVTAEILREANVHTLEAEDGLIGLELFLKYSRQIVLVLLDFSMPGLNGGQVLEQIWKIDPSVPVLFFSGYGQHEIIRRHYRSGAVGFLQKPYTINELLLAVKQNLKRD